MGNLSFIIIILAVLFAIAWICIPFMIMDMKNKLDKIIKINKGIYENTKDQE